MWKFAVPDVILCMLGVAWGLQGLAGKTRSSGVNAHPVWAAWRRGVHPWRHTRRRGQTAYFPLEKA